MPASSSCSHIWEVIEKGPTPIYEAFNTIVITDSTYVPKIKDSHKYTTGERKEASLDNYVKGLISSTVKGVHLEKIRVLDTAKEMWDTLKAPSLESEEMMENKFSMVCNKFDEFKMQPGETIDHMKTWFLEITIEISTLKKYKYTQREMNLKVIRALPATWHVYAAMHPSTSDFNDLTTERLFDILIGNEYEMICIHGSNLASSSKKAKAEKKEKDVAFKAEVAKEVQPSSSVELSKMEELL